MSKPLPSASLEAAVRNHFGLSQEELSRYLGITRGQVAHLEAGRRLPNPVLNKKLWLLAKLLPPPEGHGPVAPILPVNTLPAAFGATLMSSLPDFGPLPAAPVRARRRSAAAQAAALRWELYREAKRNAKQYRRQWGLAVLQAYLPQQATSPAERTHFDRWLGTLAADVAATVPKPADAAAHALAVVRVLVLEAEVEALNQLLAKSAGASQ